MSYYSGQGDYYGVGDPGIFGFLGKALGGVAKTVGGLVPGPVGGVLSGIGGLISGKQQPVSRFAPGPGPVPSLPPVPRGLGAIPVPGIGGAVQRVLPGGATGYAGCAPGYHLDKTTQTKCVRNRRMNPANPKALRRAIRREKAFIGLARTALRGTGYKISRTASYARKKRR